MYKILLVEDNDSLRDVLSKVVANEGYAVTSSESAEDALRITSDFEFDLILCDFKLPKKTGLDFLQELRARQNTTPFVIMTAYGSIDLAVEAMKHGASDFITKPFSPPSLCRLIGQLVQHRRIIDRHASRQNHSLLTQSKSMERVLYQAKKVAPLPSSVLLMGESGTGKELIARYIHEQSPRVSGAFVAVNCGSLPDELLESEFFGHEAGSFTGATEQRIGLFEVANNSTMFLDEIGTMPVALQTKLLRALQESEIKRLGSTKTKRVNVRIISATNCNLDKEIKAGNFREDLYYRLGVMILEIPPLRERREDISLLSRYFAQTIACECEKSVPEITPQAMKLLESHSWPGNVRELENIIERAVILTDGPITPEALELTNRTSIPQVFPTLPEATREALRKTEINLISKALLQTRGNKSKAAQLLGVSYKTLLSKVKEHHLDGGSEIATSDDPGQQLDASHANLSAPSP